MIKNDLHILLFRKDISKKMKNHMINSSHSVSTKD